MFDAALLSSLLSVVEVAVAVAAAAASVEVVSAAAFPFLSSATAAADVVAVELEWVVWPFPPTFLALSELASLSEDVDFEWVAVLECFVWVWEGELSSSSDVHWLVPRYTPKSVDVMR